MPERNSGSHSITDGRDQAAGLTFFAFAGSESFAEMTAIGPDCVKTHKLEARRE
jgi:hypothetical protein